MKTIEVVAAIIDYEGRVLCMQRKPGKHDYVSMKYEFPGGKVETSENFVDALKREILEEMELEIEVLDSTPYLTVNHAYPDFAIRMHAFRCRTHTMAFTLNDHASFQLLPVQQLISLEWAAADIPIVLKLMDEEAFA